MTRVGLGIALAVVMAGSSLAQSQAWVAISHGEARASMKPASEPYTGGPWAAVRARPLNPDSTLKATDFRIRAWVESGKTRVVLFAVDRGPQGPETETQLATFLLGPDESRDVTETERYGAAHVSIGLESQ